eukprot:scaffold5682_cov140-Cylindrotheca_fusiformis.AAC.13
MLSWKNTKTRWCLLAAVLELSWWPCTAFVPSRSPSSRVWHTPQLPMADSNEMDDMSEDSPQIAKATVKIDDGGSDLTDRFKWKVNALMGVFDPQDGADDDRQEGNILNAMLNFPVRYTFNIVGRTTGDSIVKDEYVEAVKTVVSATAGDDIACKITPRGKNFTKVQCEVEVQNAGMISTIYEELEKIEQTVMRF